MHALATYYLILPAEASSNLAKFDAMRYGLRVLPEGVDDPSAEEVMRATRDAGFGDEVKRRIILGTYALSSGYYDAYYGQAQKVRTLITRDFEAAFEQADVLVSPTAPTTAFKLGEKLDDPLAMYLNDLATIPANLSGVPGISVPSGLADEDGLPAGVQILAPALADDRGLPGRRRARGRCCATQWGGPLLDQAPPLDRRRAHDRTDRPWCPSRRRWRSTTRRSGLEVHVELNTASKMFCGCPTGFGAEPNTQVCPTCLGPARRDAGGQPARRSSRRSGSGWRSTARSPSGAGSRGRTTSTRTCRRTSRPRSTTSRSRSTAGSTSRSTARPFRVEIERAHMEEDTGKSLHVGGATGRIHGADYSLVDYNRAGIPLIEIVTKPIIGTGAKAPRRGSRVRRAAARPDPRARRLRRADGPGQPALRRQPVAGARRAPARSAPAPRPRTSTRSARSSARSATRCSGTPRVLDAGGSILQETRHWHEDTGVTTQRPREVRRRGLPLLPRARPGAGGAVAGVGARSCAARCPRTRPQKRARLQAEWGFSDLEMRDTVGAGALGLVEETIAAGAAAAGRPQVVARRAGPPRQRRRRRASPSSASRPAEVAAVQALVDAGTINDKLARQVFDGLLAGEGTPEEIVAARGLAIVSDEGALGAAVDNAIAANPDVADKIRDGKVAAAGALIGAVMKEMRGQADAGRVRELILEKLA